MDAPRENGERPHEIPIYNAPVRSAPSDFSGRSYHTCPVPSSTFTEPSQRTSQLEATSHLAQHLPAPRSFSRTYNPCIRHVCIVDSTRCPKYGWLLTGATTAGVNSHTTAEMNPLYFEVVCHHHHVRALCCEDTAEMNPFWSSLSSREIIILWGYCRNEPILFSSSLS